MEISKQRLAELTDAESKLRALENGGVDNWEWYDSSMEEYNKEKEQEEKIEDLFDNIQEVLCSSAYEPSERGAGVAFDDEAIDEAKELLKTYLKELK
jgi:hypothetical protein